MSRGVSSRSCLKFDSKRFMLTILAPGGFEAFFREVYEAGYRLPEDMERVRGVGKRFQLDFTGPPMSGREAARGG